MSVTEPVRRDSTSYRQGLVLGLTMAETLLLLVFCLLIAAAAIFVHRSAELDKLREEKQALQQTLREALKDPTLTITSEIIITDDWRQIVRALEDAGISGKDARDAKDLIVEAAKAHKDGLTDGDVTGSIAFSEAVKKEFTDARGKVPKTETIIAVIREGLQAQTAAADSKGDGKHDWPPIILLSEAKDYFFESGSAVLSDKFRAGLKGPVMDELLGIIAKYPKASVIEVIGHTDEQRLIYKTSNLDDVLMRVLKDKEPIVRLKPADNAGLGLARAVAVSQVLLQDKRLKGFSILPYSGAQLVNVNDSLVVSGTGGDVRERRRIEIRVREPNKISIPTVAPVAPVAPTPPPVASTGNSAETQPSPSLREPIRRKPKSQPEPKPDGVKTPFGWFFRR